jgi:hypothetical protein
MVIFNVVGQAWSRPVVYPASPTPAGSSRGRGGGSITVAGRCRGLQRGGGDDHSQHQPGGANGDMALRPWTLWRCHNPGTHGHGVGGTRGLGIDDRGGGRYRLRHLVRCRYKIASMIRRSGHTCGLPRCPGWSAGMCTTITCRYASVRSLG